jgi:hypothetical protein
MSQAAKDLVTGGSSLSGSSLTGAIQWQGGRTVLVLEAAAYGAGVFLQLKSPSGGGININGTTYSANQVTAYDLPAGTYGMVVQSGICTSTYAKLCAVPYDF